MCFLVEIKIRLHLLWRTELIYGQEERTSENYFMCGIEKKLQSVIINLNRRRTTDRCMGATCTKEITHNYVNNQCNVMHHEKRSLLLCQSFGGLFFLYMKVYG